MVMITIIHCLPAPQVFSGSIHVQQRYSDPNPWKRSKSIMWIATNIKPSSCKCQQFALEFLQLIAVISTIINIITNSKTNINSKTV